MNPELTFAILRTLRECGQFMMPEATLFQAVTLAVPRASYSDIHATVRELDHRHYIVGVRDDITQQNKWKLTTEGAAVLLERGL
jgi:hypothetical protein